VSRHHYFAEWARNAEKLGYATDITKTKGELLPKTLNFMSRNRKYYEAFKTDTWVWSQVQKMEEGLKDIKIMHIPRSQFIVNQKLIQTGDILAFTSTVDGLDVNHEGIAYWEGDKLKLLNASSEKKKVIISSETILEYLNRVHKHAGVMILRPTKLANP
ncbi:MAG: N-acetylmuramoyl-L-alanine amidase-like domain-containing protein, partial [Leadbetterella sp.]